MIEKKILQVGAFWPKYQLCSTHAIPWYCFADISETSNLTLKQYAE